MHKTTIEKYKGNIEVLKNDFLKQNDVKFIVLNEKYLDLSSNNSIKEIHKFKSEYNSKRYIILPINIRTFTEMNHDGKYIEIKEIYLNNQKQNTDGFMCISKLNVFKQNNILTRYPKITQQVGTEICLKEMNKYNNILRGDIFLLKETLENGSLTQSIFYDNNRIETKQIVINKNNSITI